MIKAGLYIRVSTDEQVLHGLSLESQRDALIEYANKHNMQVVDVYADEGITARKRLDKRAEFQRLMVDVEQGKIDLILVTKLDRWFRNIRDYHNTQDILEKYNCNWRTIYENYDTSTASGRLHINIMLSVNQDECDRTSERIKAVFRHKIDKCEAITGATPLGYKIENKKLVKDQTQTKLVNDLFEYFELHNSVRGTMLYINAKYGLKLHYNTVRNILCNEIYKGAYKGNNEFTEPYLTSDRWHKIQELRGKNVKVQKGSRTYTYAGLLICSSCGRKMSGTTTVSHLKTGTQEYKNYKCQEAQVRKVCTHKHLLREDTIDLYIAHHLKQELEGYVATFDIKQDTKDYSKQRASVEKKIKRLKDLYINELIDIEEYKADLNKYKQELENIPCERAQDDLSHVKQLLAQDIDKLYLSLDCAQKQALIRSVVKCIYVDNDNKMSLVFY